MPRLRRHPFQARRGLEVEPLGVVAVGGLALVRVACRGTDPDAGEPVLVIDDGVRAHRFPALPGPGPDEDGVWRVGFSAPAALLSARRAAFAVELNGEMAELPRPEGLAPSAGVPAAAPAPPPGSIPAVQAERRARRAELAEEVKAREAAEARAAAAAARADLAGLARQLDGAAEERAALEARIAEDERQLRRTHQLAYAAERARLEALEESGKRLRTLEGEREELRQRLSDASDRAEQLGRQLERARREAAEDLQSDSELAAARQSTARSVAEAETLRAELDALGPELERVRAAATERSQVEQSVAALETEVADLRSALADATRTAEIETVELRERAEVEARARAEAQERAVDAEQRAARLERALAEAERAAADAVRGREDPRAAHRRARGGARGGGAPAGARSAGRGRAGRAGRAAVRPGLARRGPGADRSRARSWRELEAAEPVPEPDEAEPEPEPAEPEPAEPEPAAFAEGPWLPRAVVRLAAEEPRAAAHLIVQLLPAQALVIEQPLVYELSIAELGTFRVTLADGKGMVVPIPDPPDQPEGEFRLMGDAAALAELAAGGNARRMLFSGRLRIRGRRRRARGVLGAARTPVGLAAIAKAGIWLDPFLIYRALATLVDPEWTRGHRFSIAHEIIGTGGGTCYVSARNGEPLAVTRAGPEGGADATVSTTAAAFEATLAGDDAPAGQEVGIEGDLGAVRLLKTWTEWVQQGGPPPG